MGYILFHVFITIFAVFGFIEVMHLTISAFYKSNKSNSIMIIYPDSSSIEYELRSCSAKIKVPTGLKPRKIYCIEEHLSPEAREIVRIYHNDYEYIELTTLEGLKKIIDKT